jgi:hypothetical protein
MKKLFVLAVALIVGVAFALPAAAQDKAEWSWYGQTRMWTAWEMADEETLFGGSGGSRARGWNPGAGLPLQDDDELEWKLQTNARLGANVKWGNVGGRVEFGNTGEPRGGDFGTTWRLMYGTWNFGPGTLVLGKDYTPYFFLVSGLCGPGGGECNGIGWGSIYHGRRAQAKLVMGGLQVALVEPANSTSTAIDSSLSTIDGTTRTVTLAPFAVRDVDQTLPTIEASYSFNLGPVGLFIGGLYSTFDQEFVFNNAVTDISIDSWAFGLGGRSAFGPFYVNATFQYGNNVGNLNMPTTLIPARLVIDGGTLAEEDAKYMAAQGVVGFKLTDSLAFEGGVVWQNGEVDVPGGGGTIEQSTMVYYVQAQWSPAKNVFLVPEFGIIDNGELEFTGEPDIDLGKVTWFGIKWQINF